MEQTNKQIKTNKAEIKLHASIDFINRSNLHIKYEIKHGV